MNGVRLPLELRKRETTRFMLISTMALCVMPPLSEETDDAGGGKELDQSKTQASEARRSNSANPFRCGPSQPS